MGISVTDPLAQAINRSTRILFKPFNITKWFVMGFAAFLATLAEGGGGNFPNIPGVGGGGGGGGGAAPPGPAPPSTPFPDGEVESPVGQDAADAVDPVAAFAAQAWQFFVQYAWIIIPGILLAVAIWVTLLWLRARGKFIFLDCVVRNHAAIVEPWSRLRKEANSFFRFDLLLGVLVTIASLAVAYIGYLVARPDIVARTWGQPAITALVGGGVLLAVLLVVYVIVLVIAEDFVIPLMYLRSQPVGPAWREFAGRVAAGNLGMIALFFLLRFVLAIAEGIIILVGTLLTCCLAGLPYLGTVFFLPIWVFNRAFSLYFLEQVGPEFRMMMEIESAPLAAFPVVFAAPPVSPMPPPPLPPTGPGGAASV